MGRLSAAIEKNLGFLNGGSFSEIESRRVALAGAEHMERPYHENWLTYIAIKHRATAVASVPIQIWNKNPDEDDSAELIKVEDALCRLLKSKPNEHQSTSKFMRAGCTHISLDGEDIWFLMNGDGEPVGGFDIGDGVKQLIEVPTFILPWRGSNVEMRTDKFGFPAFFKYPTLGKDGKEIWYPVHSIVQFAAYDPYNPMRGLGDAEALTRVLDQYFQAERYIDGGLRNGGNWGGWIITKTDVSEETAKKAQERLTDETRNQNNNKGWKTVFGRDIDVVPNTANPRDMEYTELLSRLDKAISSTLGVPLPLLGIAQDVKFTNFEWHVEQFWKGGNGILPYLSDWEDTVNGIFIPRIKGPEAAYYVRFDRDAIEALQEDMTAKYTAAKDIASGNVGVSYFEALAMFGVDLDEGTLSEWAKKHYLGASFNAIEDRPDEVLEPVGPLDGDDDDGDEDEPGLLTVAASFVEKATQGLEEQEKLMYPVVLRYHQAYEDAQIAKLRSFARDGKGVRGVDVTQKLEAGDLTVEQISKLLLDRTEWDAKLAGKLSPLIEQAFNEGTLSVIDAIGGVLLGPEDQAVIAFLKTRRIAVVEGINSTLAKRVKAALLEVFGTNPTSIGSLQQIINELLPDLTAKLRAVFGTKEARALMIARTESGIAVNGGRFEQMKQSGVKEHTWRTANDEHVREEHFNINGHTETLGDEFIIGTGLKFPLDPAADISLIANCRCVAEPVQIK